MAKEKRATSELNVALAGIEAFFAVAENGNMDAPTVTIDRMTMLRAKSYVETARTQLTVISSNLAKL